MNNPYNMALKDILEQIKKETEEKINTLKKEHDKKMKEIDSKFGALKKEAGKEMNEQVKVNSKKILNKMSTVAKMEAKNKLLKEKRELLDVIFETALEKLASSGDYQKMLTGLLKHSELSGEGITVVPAKGKESDTKAAVENSGKNYRIAERSAAIKGGFILKSDKIEIDNSFESILNKQLRDDLELEVAKTLFA
jgi:vacuolar-type H+-ATPase subunit E/Vma4